MRRIIFSDEEYAELARFAAERQMNPKEAVLAFVRLGNRARQPEEQPAPPAGPPQPDPATLSKSSEPTKF